MAGRPLFTVPMLLLWFDVQLRRFWKFGDGLERKLYTGWSPLQCHISPIFLMIDFNFFKSNWPWKKLYFMTLHTCFNAKKDCQVV